MQPHLRFAHLAFDFRLRHQRRDRVDDDDVDAVRADEDFDDLERLLAVVGLRDEQIVDVHTELLRIVRVEGVLGVDERGHTAQLLRFGDDLQRQRGLARRLGPENLDDAAARHAADAERVVDADRARGNGFDRLNGPLLAKPHDRAFAELLLDLAEGNFDGLLALPLLTFVSFDGHLGGSSGSPAILKTCRAKVKRNIVNDNPEITTNKHVTKQTTFASGRAGSQNLR